MKYLAVMIVFLFIVMLASFKHIETRLKLIQKHIVLQNCVIVFQDDHDMARDCVIKTLQEHE